MKPRRLWHWWAMDDEGVLNTGHTFASDRATLTQALAALAQVPLRIKAGRHYTARHWQPDAKISLFRQLGTLLNTGVSLAEAFRLLGEGEVQPHWQALMLDIRQRLQSGEPFSETLRQWPDVFSPLSAAMMAVGERTGSMATCCEKLAHQQQRQRALQKKVAKALRYPLFILAVAVLVSLGMLLFVLPQFTAIYRSFDAPLPGFTSAVIALAEGLQAQGLTLGAVLCTVGWAARRFIRHSAKSQRQLQRGMLRFPLLGALWQGSQLSLLYNTLSLTQTAGLTLLVSLQSAEEVFTARIWQEAIAEMRPLLSGGEPLHQCMAQSGLFTSLCLQLIRTGEETGTLDTLLKRLAEWHEQGTHERADNLAATLEPLLMLVTGGLVGALVIAMYLPLFGLGEAMSG